MMTALAANEVLPIFERSKALLKGHFLLSSGRHSDQYLQCALVLADPVNAETLGRALASLQTEKPDLVVSPAMGGLIIGHEVARALGVRAYFTERQEGVMTLRRGFSIKRGERVVVVEDVITTGKSSREVIDTLTNLGATVIAALSIINRNTQPPNLGVPVKSLVNLPVASWDAAQCALCRTGIPVVKPGSRATQQP